MHTRRAVLASLAAAPAYAGVEAWADACRLAPETTAGPFYLGGGRVRRDVTEGRPGAPLTLALQVVGPDCAPVEGARLDLWHTDAQGAYSGVEGDDGTFMRGTQRTGPGGAASFSTIWPGWYPGRATHFHLRVILDRKTLVTTQIFLPEDMNERIHATAPYAGRPTRRRVRNDEDWIARRAGPAAMASVRRDDKGFAAALVVGVAGAG